MKKIIMALIVISLIAPQGAMAKNSDLVQVEYVQSNKKGLPALITLIRIGVRVYRVASRVNNVNRLVEKIKKYVDENGIERTQIAQHFFQELKIVLIESFYASKPSYKPFEKIVFKAKLKQRAYTYIVSLSHDGACLIFPNGADKKNLYRANSYYTFANKGYKIYANKKGAETFYFIASTQPLLSQLKGVFNISTGTYACGKRHKGRAKLNALASTSGVEVRGLDLLIE